MASHLSSNKGFSGQQQQQQSRPFENKPMNAPAEGSLTKKVEQVTAKVPSLGYLGLAFASMAVSAGLALLTKKKGAANFIGLWVPSILIMGLYNKLVKTHGSDQSDNSAQRL